MYEKHERDKGGMTMEPQKKRVQVISGIRGMNEGGQREEGKEN
jgi:hypothetical protein